MYLKHQDQCYVNMQKVDFKAKIVTEDRGPPSREKWFN